MTARCLRSLTTERHIALKTEFVGVLMEAHTARLQVEAVYVMEEAHPQSLLVPITHGAVRIAQQIIVPRRIQAGARDHGQQEAGALVVQVVAVVHKPVL